MTHAEDVQRGYDDKRRKDAHGSVRRVGDLLGPGAADELLVAYEEAAKRDVGFERERWPIPLLVAGLIWAGRAIVQLRATQLGVVTTVAPDPDATFTSPDATGCTCPKKWHHHDGVRERVIARQDPKCPNHGVPKTTRECPVCGGAGWVEGRVGNPTCVPCDGTGRLRLTVTKTPGVCGGVACLANTRMPVWILSRLDDGQVRSFYPHLTEQQIADARSYAAANPEEMRRDIDEHASFDPEDAARAHVQEHARGDDIAAEREYRSVARNIDDAIIDRYTRCAMALWQLFDKDPLGEDCAAYTSLERLEAIVAKKLLAPTADLKTALRLGGKALALVVNHEFGDGSHCLVCLSIAADGHTQDCDWGKLVAEAKALSRGG